MKLGGERRMQKGKLRLEGEVCSKTNFHFEKEEKERGEQLFIYLH